MTEEDARDWVSGKFGTARVAHLERFAGLLAQESTRQNLVSRSTLESLWCRHIVDSAQLLDFAPDEGLWIDIGTGGGFPGIVVALLRDAPIMLVEPRRKRAEFLSEVAKTLGLNCVTVKQCRIASIGAVTAAVISARAVASIDSLLRDTRGVANRGTVFVFPRGRSGADEISAAKQKWRGMFHVKHSITDPEAAIVVARDVRAI